MENNELGQPLFDRNAIAHARPVQRIRKAKTESWHERLMQLATWRRLAMVIALIVSLASGAVVGGLLAHNNAPEANNIDEESQLQANDSTDPSTEGTYEVSEPQVNRVVTGYRGKRKIRTLYIRRYPQNRAYKFAEIH